MLQKEKYPERYREIFKDETLRKSHRADVSVCVERCAVQIEKEEGKQSIKTVIDNNIIGKCKHVTTLSFRMFSNGLNGAIVSAEKYKCFPGFIIKLNSILLLALLFQIIAKLSIAILKYRLLSIRYRK